MRLANSALVGGAPAGTTNVGAFPQVPAAPGLVRGEKAMGFVATVVVVVGEVVVVAIVVVVVVGDFPAKSRMPVPKTTTATTATMMPRRVFWRRFARRCIASILIRRAAF